MIHRAYALSSATDAFNTECAKLRSTFSRLDYPVSLINSAAEHKNSAIGRHFLEAHGNNNLLNENQFTVLRRCQGKFDCLVFEMLFIKNLKPNLNIQTDAIRAKLFV